MITPRIAAALLASTLGMASPAQAQSVTPANQADHFMGLFTDAGNDCIDSKKLTDAERAPSCEKALSELADRRKAATDPSVAELANLDFYEAFMQIAMANAYSHIDGAVSKRTCIAAERSWTLDKKLMLIPKAALDPDFYAAYHSVPPAVNRVLGECRGLFGTPADGAPLPPAAAS
ncbi:MAG: hypothetical protein WBL74_08115 [Novosphingobium sp.]|uniref:hypothetical protein n=1 Tax=Novosphingobium sp. TaxID=1874826 RepID=UPI003C7B3E63